MRVLYVWDAEYPWDVRTEKVCLALVAAGHRVVITARNLKNQPLSEERPEGLIERMPTGSGNARWRSFPAFFNPYWVAHLRRLVRKHSIDLIMVRDLPLAPTALWARTNQPVILDMAENYPAMIQDIWTDQRQKPVDFLVRNPTLVGHLERSTVTRMDHVITVVEESKDRVVALGLSADRVSVVSNTPSRGRVTPPKPRSPDETMRVVYLGLMEKHRGIGCTLDAAAILTGAGVRFHLDVVGDGRDFEHFRGQAAALGLDGTKVTFHGRLPHTEAIGMIARGHVGLVPHEARESWNTTIPNKLFDYMAAGLAVVSSDAAPAARVVEATGAGLVFRSGNAEELADRIQRYLDLSLWEQHRRAGQEAVRSRYNWEFDTDVLIDVVAKVGGGRAR